MRTGEPLSYETSELIDLVSVHNEVASISATLREFHAIVMVEGRQPVRFVICGDGSTDDSATLLMDVPRQLPLLPVTESERKEYSNAVIDGFRGSTSSWIGFIDSDGQCLRHDADLILEWGNPRSDHWINLLFSGAFRIAFIMRDALKKIVSGRRGMLRQGFWWEFMARASSISLRVLEVPIRHRARVSRRTEVYRPSEDPRIAEHLMAYSAVGES